MHAASLLAKDSRCLTGRAFTGPCSAAGTLCFGDAPNRRDAKLHRTGAGMPPQRRDAVQPGFHLTVVRCPGIIPCLLLLKHLLHLAHLPAQKNQFIQTLSIEVIDAQPGEQVTSSAAKVFEDVVATTAAAVFHR